MRRVPSVKEVIAVDRSLKFINFAREMNEDQNILYECMNVEDEWQEEWKQKYTMVNYYIDGFIPKVT